MRRFEFVIAGPPMSAQSHNLKRLADFKVRVAAAAAERWTGQPIRGNVRVVVTYYHEGETAHLDSDNMIKPILDALIGVAYVDDRQATHIEARSLSLQTGRQHRVGGVVARKLIRRGDFLHVLIEEKR